MSIAPVEVGSLFDDVLPVCPTAEEVALGAELAALDRADDAEAYDGWDDALAGLVASSESDEVDRLGGPADPADLMLLASIDPRSLDDAIVRVRYLQALDRVAGLVSALQHDAVVALSGAHASPRYLDEVHVEHEIAIARRTSRYTAGRAVEAARALETVFPGFRDALRAGEIGAGHVSVLVERTRAVTDEDTLARIGSAALPRAARLTVGQFAREVTALVARFDRDAAARAATARQTRRVWSRQVEDGMGYLGMTHDWPTIKAITDAVTADGRALQLSRGGAAAAADGDQDAAADACRADALAARVLGTIEDDGSVTWDRSKVTVVVDVVIDLDTLRREAVHVALLDGQPVPAEAGREAAAWATAWRRMVTDPVDGHLLDYGTTTYLPGRLRRFTFARDDTCRAPCCSVRSHARLDLEHATPWPDGPSSTANCGAACRTCHQLKTAGHAAITDSRTDGSCTWTTAWGQTIHVPPRPVLPATGDPDPPPPLEPPSLLEPPLDDEPPF